MRKDLIALNKRILTPLLKKSKIPKNNSLYRELKTTLSNIPEVRLENEAGSFHLTLPDTHMKMSIISGTLCDVVYRIYNSSQDYNSNKYTEYTQICDTSGSCIHIDLQSVLNVENTYVDIVLINEKELHFNYQINNCIFVLKSVLYKISDTPLTSSKKHTVIAYKEGIKYKEDSHRYIDPGDVGITGANGRLFQYNNAVNGWDIRYTDDGGKTFVYKYFRDFYPGGIDGYFWRDIRRLYAIDNIIVSVITTVSSNTISHYYVYVAISSDNGETWNISYVGRSHNTVDDVNTSVFSPSATSINYYNGTLVIGTGVHYIYTTDFGKTIISKKLPLGTADTYYTYKMPELDKDNKFIILGEGKLLTSDDAINWAEQIINLPTSISVFKHKDILIVTPQYFPSNGTEFYINIINTKTLSIKSKTITSTRTTSSSTDFRAPVIKDNTYLFMTKGGYGMYSNDKGSTWNQFELSGEITNPVYANGIWLCLPSPYYSGDTYDLYYSKDNCKTWTTKSFKLNDYSYQSYVLNPVYNNGLFITLIRKVLNASSGYGDKCLLSYSYDGLEWKYLELSNKTTSGQILQSIYNDILYVNKKWYLKSAYRWTTIYDLLNTPITEVT